MTMPRRCVGLTALRCLEDAYLGLAAWAVMLSRLRRSDRSRQAGGFGLFLGVVAGADERAGFDVAEAHGEGLVLEEGELVGRVEAREDEVVATGPEVLPDGKDVHVAVGEVAEDLEEFVHLFAE